MNDFRSERMPSPDGRGFARAAWEAYAAATKRYVMPALDKTPIGDAVASISANKVSDLVGFWMLWHLSGGFEGLQKLGMSRSSIYRKIGLFRTLFEAHPDEYVFPGITIDVAAYHAGQAPKPTEADGI